MEKRPTLLCSDSRTPAKNISRQDALLNPRGAESWYIGGTRESWTAFHRTYHLTVKGSAVFWMQTSVQQCTFKGGKLYGSISPFWKELCGIFNLDWISTNLWVMNILANRKDMWKAVLTGKYTNPEALTKGFSKKYFKGAYSYRSLKQYFKMGAYSVNLWDLFYYSSNPELALCLAIKASDSTDSYNYWTLFKDCLKDAEFFNEKISPKWSEKRLNEVHRHWTNIRMGLMKVENMSSEPIHEPFCRDNLELILDEQTSFMEGCYEENCVHTCYWTPTTEGKYLIAKGYVLGEKFVHLGIYKNKEGRLELQQLHCHRNGTVLDWVKEACVKWIAKYEKELLTIMEDISREHQRKQLHRDSTKVPDIPW